MKTKESDTVSNIIQPKHLETYWHNTARTQVTMLADRRGQVEKRRNMTVRNDSMSIASIPAKSAYNNKPDNPQGNALDLSKGYTRLQEL